jgi:Transketolase, N-terminal subunit
MGIDEFALKIRQEVLKMACHANGGHIAPAYSMTDIISVLYFDNVLRYNEKNPNWDDRDMFILSKGHGVLALYAALSIAGYFPIEELTSFCKPGSRLGSLAKYGSVPGIEATTGSLGHGLSYAVGIALANKIDKNDSKTYVLLGDGECEEGSVWEGFLSASHHRLDNLVVIIDNNKLQAMGSVESILSIQNFPEKLGAFGFSVEDIDGHDYQAIKRALLYKEKDKPRAIVANTIKGKGISFMENTPIWHYRIPDEVEIEVALKELKMTREELGIYENSLFRNII